MKAIRNYLHLYLGCDFKWQWKEGDDFKQRKLDASLLQELHLYKLPYKQWLILRPLSSITEEEVAMFFDLDVNAITIKANYLEPFFQIEYIDDKGEQTYEHQYLSQLKPSQLLYLLSIHIDLFGLIEEGLAIKAENMHVSP